MTVKLNDIKEIFYLLLEKVISRDVAQKIAIEIRETYDNGNLEFYPKEYENKIWDAVQFIELFAELESENVYLYNENDLINYINDARWANCQ